MNNLANMVQTRLENNAFGENSIAIYGGAYFLAQDIEDDTFTMDKMLVPLKHAVINARFFNPDVNTSSVIKNFCHLLLIDPALIELYFGFRLNAI